MSTLIFDLETNGLLDVVTKVHCLVIGTEDGQIHSYADQPGHQPIWKGLEQLATATTLVAHNGLGFDLPVLAKLYPTWKHTAKVRDTLIMAKLVWPDIIRTDFALANAGKLPPNRRGSYSLEAFGYRMRKLKGEYAKEMEAKGIDPWAAWNPEMQEYCVNDVEVTTALWLKIKEKRFSEECFDLEHDFQALMNKQEANGVLFDEPAAAKLYAALLKEQAEVRARLSAAFPEYWLRGEVITPAKTTTYRDPRRPSPTAGAPFQRISRWRFDVAKAASVVEALRSKYEWKPTVYTKKTGEPKVDEDTLKVLPYPETQDILHAMLINKRLGQLAQGTAALMRSVKQGRIHGRVDGQGTVTRRCAHKSPNIAQVPNASSLYGKEFRSLFVADPGKVMIGFDVSGFQLRGLAHYLAPYDDGRYITDVTTGDVHTRNADVWGLKSGIRRALSKTATYSYLFGCYPGKTGTFIIEDLRNAGEDVSGANTYKLGQAAQDRFTSNLGLDRMLKAATKAAASRGGYLKALDGGLLKVRENRVILACLLQSAEAVIMKKMGLLFVEKLAQEGLLEGRDYWLALHVHDEQQVIAEEKYAELIGAAFHAALQAAAQHFRFRCPLDGEVKVGRNWHETH